MRLAILSDIHEDYERLQRIIVKAEARGYDKLICLGDISGFSLPYYKYDNSRNASACLSLIREKCDIILAGNHDLHAAGTEPELPDVLAGKESWQHEMDLDPGYSDEEKSFLAGLPLFSVMPIPGGKILLSHYVYPNLSGFIKGIHTNSEEFRAHFEFMQQHKCGISFTGHAHPSGFYRVRPGDLKHYHRRSVKIDSLPAIIGIPPATRNQDHSSFCIFDAISHRLQVFK